MDNNDKIFQSIAVLIDGDNASYRHMPTIIDMISTYGRVTVKRVYGNWSKENLKGWRSVVNTLGLKAQHQFDYVKGKNTTDIVLVIDAMNLLHSNKHDAFVIVSNDSDFTPLCIELKEKGVYVIGVGTDNAQESFKRACDAFVSVNKLMASISADTDIHEEPAVIEPVEGNLLIAESVAPHNNQGNNTETITIEPVDEDDEDNETEILALSPEDELHRLLKIGAATEKWQDDDGFVNVAGVGDFIKRTRPEFDITQFGFKKLPDFIAAHTDFYEMKRYKGKGSVYIRAYKCK